MHLLHLLICASIASALGADEYYDFMYSVTELRMFQGADVKPLWTTPEAIEKAQKLAEIASTIKADAMLQFPLTIDTDSGSGSDSNHDTALYAMGSDIAEAVRSWSDDCPKCKDSLISPRFTVVGLARVGDYWTAYLTQ